MRRALTTPASVALEVCLAALGQEDLLARPLVHPALMYLCLRLADVRTQLAGWQRAGQKT